MNKIFLSQSNLRVCSTALQIVKFVVQLDWIAAGLLNSSTAVFYSVFPLALTSQARYRKAVRKTSILLALQHPLYGM